MRVTPFRVVHDDRAGPCLGYRCEAEGKTVAYSGDTQWTDTVIDIGRNADLFICEAYTRDKPITTHMALSALEKHLAADQAEAAHPHPYEPRHAGAPRRSAVRIRRRRQ